MNFLGVHFAWAFNLCFARSICPSGVQCLRRSRGKALGCLPFTFNPSPLTFSSICASHVQFALRAFNCLRRSRGKALGCLPFTFNPLPLTFSSICASHVQFALRAFNCLRRSRGKALGCLPFTFNPSPLSFNGVQVAKSLSCLPVTPLHRYTVTPLYRYTVIQATTPGFSE